jgi:hypothetical protein
MMLTNKDRERIGRLQKRAQHLRERITDSPDDLSYDRAELSAVEWAIAKLFKES